MYIRSSCILNHDQDCQHFGISRCAFKAAGHQIPHYRAGNYYMKAAGPRNSAIISDSPVRMRAPGAGVGGGGMGVGVEGRAHAEGLGL